MPSATFNEFVRELNKAELSATEKYFFAMLYERFGDVLKSNDDTAKVVLQLAETMKNFVQLNEAMEKKLQRLARGQNTDGVDVSSVVNKPEPN
jgi:hypothetical protein